MSRIEPPADHLRRRVALQEQQGTAVRSRRHREQIPVGAADERRIRDHPFAGGQRSAGLLTEARVDGGPGGWRVALDAVGRRAGARRVAAPDQVGAHMDGSRRIGQGGGERRLTAPAESTAGEHERRA